MFLPAMEDCERGLGRPEKALRLADDPAVSQLDTAGQLEMLIVAAGARMDQGESAAAIALLDQPARLVHDGAGAPLVRYSFANVRWCAGCSAVALSWFTKAAAADVEGMTDDVERAEELRAKLAPAANPSADS